jgi:hypothetical protein
VLSQVRLLGLQTVRSGAQEQQRRDTGGATPYRYSCSNVGKSASQQVSKSAEERSAMNRSAKNRSNPEPGSDESISDGPNADLHISVTVLTRRVRFVVCHKRISLRFVQRKSAKLRSRASLQIGVEGEYSLRYMLSSDRFLADRFIADRCLAESSTRALNPAAPNKLRLRPA